MDTMSPYSPNVSDSSSWCTNFDRCPTQRVVLHTERCRQLHLITQSLTAQKNTVAAKSVKLLNFTNQKQGINISCRFHGKKNSIKSSRADEDFIVKVQ